MKVFVDSGAWLAFYDRQDEHHSRASTLVRQLKQQRTELVLSDFVFSESVTIIRYRVGHRQAMEFGRLILESRLGELIDVTEPLRRRAWDIFQQYDDKEFSFVDCTSFAIMEELGLKAAFAFDRHFEQYGFQLLQATSR